MKKLILLASALMLTTGTVQAAEKMRCSHQLPPRHHIAIVIGKWAEEVKKHAGGELDVQVFGANSLMGAAQNISSVAQGNIECAFSVNFQWGKTLPIMNVTLRPYSVTDLATLKAWPGSEAAKFLDAAMEKKSVRNVVWLFTTRMSAFTSKGKALIKPDDFKGVKIRGLNPIVDSSLVAMGAAPAVMPGSAVYQALSTGVIDAGLTDISAAYSRKYYEVQDYITGTPFFSVFFHGYLNPAWYDKLPAKAKAAIAEAGKQAAVWAIDATEASAADAPKLLAEKGMKVHMHTDAEVAVMKAATLPAFDKAFAEATGDEGKKLLELVGKLSK